MGIGLHRVLLFGRGSGGWIRTTGHPVMSRALWTWLSYAAMGARAVTGPSWCEPPWSRTRQLTAYQAVPFTGWVVARGGSRRSRSPGGRPPLPGSGRGPLLGGFTIHGRMVQESNLRRAPHPGHRFPAGHLPPRSTIPCGGRAIRKPMPLASHPLATEPGTPVRFTLPECRPRDSDPDHLRTERSASASWARAAWSG